MTVEGGKALQRLRTMMAGPASDRPADWANPLEKIEELLSCAICLDRYKNPKLLPCQHSFCLDCLDGCCDSIRRVIKCPECRAEHSLPYDGAKNLQTNFTLVRFLEIHLQATEENAEEMESYINRFNLERCKVCDEKAELDLCTHCDKRVCGECRNTHLEMIKRDLSRLMGQVKRLSNRITEASDGLSKGLDSLTLNTESVKEDVKDATRRLYKELKKKEESLLSEIETWTNVETRLMKGLRESLELESSNISEACARLEAYLKGERELPDGEIIRYKQMFTDGLDFLRNFSVDADDLCQKKIRFQVKEDTALMQQQIAALGELQVMIPQFGGRFNQLEAQYVPKVMHMGLESDQHKNKKNRMLELAEAQSGAERTGRQNGTGRRGGDRAQDDDALNYPSSRFRRHQRHLDVGGEDQPWQRYRCPSPGDAPRRHSPRMSHHVADSAFGDNDNNGSPQRYVRHHLEVSPFGKMTETGNSGAGGLMSSSAGGGEGIEGAAELNQTTATENGGQGAGSSTAVGNQARKNRFTTRSRQKSSVEDESLNLKVENIRKEHEQRREQKSTTTTTTTTGRTGSHHRSNSRNQQSQRQQQQNLKKSNPSSTVSTTTTTTTSISTAGTTSPATKTRASTSTSTSKHQSGQIQNGSGGGGSSSSASSSATTAAGPPSFLKSKAATTVSANKSTTRPPTADDSPTAANDRNNDSQTTDDEDVDDDDDDENDEEGGNRKQIPIMIYPKDLDPPQQQKTSNPSQKRSSFDNGTSSSASATAAAASAKTAVPTPKVMDWKKYLIPHPYAELYGATSGVGNTSQNSTDESPSNHHRSPAAAAAVQRTDSRDSEGSQNGGDSWAERRKRWVRSKTNPDLLPPSSNDNNTSGGSGSQQPKSGRSRYREQQRKSENRNNNNNTNRTGSGRSVVQQQNNDGDGDDSVVRPTASNVYPPPNVPYSEKGRDGKVFRKFGKKGGASGEFNWPRGVAVVPGTDEIVVCDSSNHRTQLFDKRGAFKTTFGSYGTGTGQFDCLAGVTVNKYRQFIITDRYNHRIQVFDESGRFMREFGAHGQTNGRFNNPWGVVVDGQGFIYVCDKDNHRVQIFQADGNYVGKFGGIGNREGQFQNPHFIAVTKQNNLIVSDSGNHRVQVFDHNGHFQFAFGSEGFNPGQFKYPRGVAVDQQGFIIVADSGNNRIQVFYPDGNFYCGFGSWGTDECQLKGVEGVAVTSEGRCIVTDRENHRLQIF